MRKKLLEKLLQNGLQNISGASLAHFSQCTASELTNFIIVRVLMKHDTVSKQMYLKDQNIPKLPNKKHLANAEIGEDCLILRAYKLKDTKVKMMLPDKPKLILSLCRDVWAGPIESNAEYDSQGISQIASHELFKYSMA